MAGRYALGPWSPAALLIGLAGAMKLYPFYYGVLFLARRDYRNALLCLGSGAVLTLLAALVLHGGPAAQLQGFLGEMQLTESCIATYDICNNFSLLFTYKTVLHRFGFDFASHADAVRYGYQALCLGLGLATTWLIFRFRPGLAYLMVLASCIVLWLPIMSMDYKPILLLVPLFLLLQSDDRRALLIGLLLLFVLLPKRALELQWGGHWLNQLLLGVSFLLAVALTVWPQWRVGAPSWRMLQRGAWCGALLLAAGYGVMILRHVYVPAFADAAAGMDFSRQDAPGHYAFGWGPVEQNGSKHWRWMQGCMAQINLRLYSTHDYRLQLQAGTHDGNPHQQLTLLFNDVPLGTQAIPVGDAAILTYIIPVQAITPTKIMPDRLTLLSTQCARSSTDGAEARGVALYDMRFEPLP